MCHFMNGVDIRQGDVRDILPTLPAESVHCVVTSPPYWGLRDYGCEGQIGLERTPEEYIANMVAVFREVRRVLRSHGTLWLNMGDSYASAWVCNRRNKVGNGSMPNGKRDDRPNRLVSGLKEKDLCGIPWMLAFALRADGWHLRQDIIWAKPNPMPEPVKDRCTKAHEYIFLLSKSEKYYFDAEAIAEPSVTNDIRRPYGSQGAWDLDGRPEEQRHGGEPRSFKGSKFNEGKTGVHQLNRSSDKPRIHDNLPGRGDGGACTNPGQEFRNKRSVWEVTIQPFPEGHFATFPEELIKPCILAGCPAGGTVLSLWRLGDDGAGGTKQRLQRHPDRVEPVLCSHRGEAAGSILPSGDVSTGSRPTPFTLNR